MNNPLSSSQSQAVKQPIHPDAVLKSTPETVLWGYIAANLPPALTIRSGQIVAIEALSKHLDLSKNLHENMMKGDKGVHVLL